MSKVRLVGALWVFLLGAIFGAAFYFGLSSLLLSSEEQAAYDYSLLAKRVQIEEPNDITLSFTDLRTKLETYISELPNGDDVALYFEYLPTGTAININENSEKVAASLMKLPVVMNIYKASELGVISMEQQLTVKKENLNSEYGELYKKGEGYQITVREAASLALMDSDNTAISLLLELLKKVNFLAKDDSLNYLDINYQVVDDVVEIDPRSYSSILKCLYFSCYNNKEASQEILTYLTQSSFNNRLTKYLPNSLLVAHKIGTFSTISQSDCGVIYLEDKNYILCVMVTGQDEVSSEIIAELSKMVHERLQNK